MKINTVASARKLLSPGWYFAEITKAQFFPSGNPQRTSGNNSNAPLVDVELVTKGNGDSEVEGVKLFDTQSLLPQSQWSAVLMAEAVFGELEVDEDGDTEIEWADMTGQPVLVQVTIQRFRGQTNNSVSHYAHISTPIGDDGFPVVSSSEAVIVGGETLVDVSEEEEEKEDAA